MVRRVLAGLGLAALLSVVVPILTSAPAMAAPPVAIQQCMNGGWHTLTGASGQPFKNQGQCISYEVHAPAPLSVTYTVNCPVLFVTVPVTLDFVSQAPRTASPGAPVALSGVGITVSLPASVVNLSIQELGFTTLGAQITADNVNATNTTEGTVNATPTPVNFTVNLIANQPFVQVLSTPATVGPWTAGSSGTITFTPGALNLTLTAPGGLSESSVCAPATTPTLGTTAIR